MHEPTGSLLTVDVALFPRVNHKNIYETIRLNQVPGALRLSKASRIGRTALLAWVSAGASSARPVQDGGSSGDNLPTIVTPDTHQTTDDSDNGDDFRGVWTQGLKVQP